MRTDRTHVRCEDFRDATSAALDGEPTGFAAADVDAHRATCAACRSWQHDIEALTRRARVRGADGAPAGFVESVLRNRPSLRRRHRVTVLRWLLAAVGLVQVGFAVPLLVHDDLGMAMSEHASHESGAWNLAVAVTLLLVALRPARVGGALAAVGTFVVALVGFSVADFVTGGVSLTRLSTHVAVLAGAGLLVALQRVTRGLPGGVPLDPAVADPDQQSHALHNWSTRLGHRRDVA